MAVLSVSQQRRRRGPAEALSSQLLKFLDLRAVQLQPNLLREASNGAMQGLLALATLALSAVSMTIADAGALVPLPHYAPINSDKRESDKTYMLLSTCRVVDVLRRTPAELGFEPACGQRAVVMQLAAHVAIMQMCLLVQ